MALNPKNQEKLDGFESELRSQGGRLSATKIAEFGPLLNSKKLEDALRASIYIANLHERNQAADGWDGLISVDELLAVFQENV